MQGISITTMESVPARSNPFNYDRTRMGTQINERYVAMFSDSTGNDLIIVDTQTGCRVKLDFSAAAAWHALREKNRKTLNNMKRGISDWVDLSGGNQNAE